MALCIDAVHACHVRFLVTVSKDPQYLTATQIEHIKGKTKEEDFCATLDEALRIYKKNGFVVTKICADSEFETLLAPLEDGLDVVLDIAPAGAHVPEIERSNRTAKERFRACHHCLPFTVMPKAMIIAMFLDCVCKLNFFP